MLKQINTSYYLRVPQPVGASSFKSIVPPTQVRNLSEAFLILHRFFQFFENFKSAKHFFVNIRKQEPFTLQSKVWVKKKGPHFFAPGG